MTLIILLGKKIQDLKIRQVRLRSLGKVLLQIPKGGNQLEVSKPNQALQ